MPEIIQVHPEVDEEKAIDEIASDIGEDGYTILNSEINDGERHVKVEWASEKETVAYARFRDAATDRDKDLFKEMLDHSPFRGIETESGHLSIRRDRGD